MLNDLKAILASNFDVDVTDIAAESRLQDLELDLLAVAELALIIEDDLGARISDKELCEAQQLAAISQLIERRRATA